eukprot:2381557-Amphidinium_carterae.1
MTPFELFFAIGLPWREVTRYCCELQPDSEGTQHAQTRIGVVYSEQDELLSAEDLEGQDLQLSQP